ncbi:hypothetical protein BDA96_04G378300 [Sorghum bicolor]|uniref:Uncharacterized protein n=2 Tax=Sorghum bicolor TaxID=4558 RepID=A0A921RAU9_SORBI|nr:hypothetical protein BDA96_04G378300 [Sorghum bicolor]OQU85999.1 hypothetical protein SORBI_3004G352750 [Sorghum bicolor]
MLLCSLIKQATNGPLKRYPQQTLVAATSNCSLRGGKQERAADYRLAEKTSVIFFYVYCLVKSMQGSTDLVTGERKKEP